MMVTATDYRVAKAPLAGLCAIADRRFPVSITDLTSQGCEACLDTGDGMAWDPDTDFCKLTIGDQLSINGRVVAISGSSAQIGFFGHIHPIAVAKLQRFRR